MMMMMMIFFIRVFANSKVPMTGIGNQFLACSLLIVLMTEAARTTEMSVNFYQTTLCNIPEGSRLQ
jgi:hypothetical protein